MPLCTEISLCVANAVFMTGLAEEANLQVKAAVSVRSEVNADLSTSQEKLNKQKAQEGEYERDTDQPEELSEQALRSLLLKGVPGSTHDGVERFPPGRGSGIEKFSVAFSYSAFDGWVRQDSPSCAAASVAGACNAILGRSRRDPGAFNQFDVLEIYKKVISAQARAKASSLERLLRVPTGSLSAGILPLLRKELSSREMSLHGSVKKGTGMKKTGLLKLVLELAGGLKEESPKTREESFGDNDAIDASNAGSEVLMALASVGAAALEEEEEEKRRREELERKQEEEMRRMQDEKERHAAETAIARKLREHDEPPEKSTNETTAARGPLPSAAMPACAVSATTGENAGAAMVISAPTTTADVPLVPAPTSNEMAAEVGFTVQFLSRSRGKKVRLTW